MIFLALLVCCVSVLYIHFIWKGKRRRLLELASLTPFLKGGLPILGHALVFYGDTEHLWQTFEKVMKETTEAGGVLAVWFGPSLQYMVTDPEDAATILNKCLGKNRYIYDMSNRFLGNSLINSNVPRWKRNRKLYNPSFSQHMLNRFQYSFNEQSRELLKSLEPFAGTGNADIWPILSDAAITIVCMTVFGISKANKNLISQDYKKAIHDNFSILSKRVANVFLHSDFTFKLSSLKKTEDEILKILHRQSSEVIAERKKEREAENGATATEVSSARFESFLDVLLDLEEYDHYLDLKDIRDELNGAISAGYDTLATGFPYILMLIGSYPEVQAKLYEEIISVVGPEADFTKYHDLPYLDAVIKESFRLYPPVPVVSRDCDEEVKLKNYTLPAGCHCTVGIWAMHRLPIWGEDAEQFRPERWLDPDSLPKNLDAYCAFSIGKRNCIGKAYSMLFVKTVIMYVVRRFRISSDVSKLKLKFEIMLKPASGDSVSLELR